MPISRRSFSAGLVSLLSARRTRAAPVRPKLLVLVIAEQFRSEYLERAQSALVPAGFRRMMVQGAYFPDCRMSASTFTASGLATVSTGAWPQAHGIVADAWYDMHTQKVMHARLEEMQATSWADQVNRERRSRMVAIGVSGVNAELVAGRSPLALVFMDGSGQFGMRGRGFEWFPAYQRARPVENCRNAAWTAFSAKPDAPPLRVLKYDASRPQEFVALYKASPFALGAQFELAREVVLRERLGQAETFDVLLLVLGGFALLGYETGSDSPLMQQMVLSLDRHLEAAIEVLDKAVGSANYDLVFTAAHGAPPAPEPAQRAKMAIPGEAVARAINRTLSDRFDSPGLKNRYVEHYVYPFLYLRSEQLRRYDIDPRQARLAAAQSALQVPGVTGYYTLDGDCSQGGEWLRRFQNSFHAVRSGDVMLSYAPEYVEDFGGGRGISYGSLYNYDERVPLLMFGAQFRAGVFEDQVESIDLTPTLSRAAGVSLPSSSTGRVLNEAFR